MNCYALSHLSDGVLLRGLSELVAHDRAITAELLAHLAEVDARKLYLPAAYPSMFAWCVGELKLSEDAAYKRIRAARAARQHPAICTAVAEGRLSLSAVVLLAPCLTPANAGDLLARAEGRTRAEVEQLLAERFPRPDLPDLVREFQPGRAACQLAPGPVQGNVNPLGPGPLATAGSVFASAPCVATEAHPAANAPCEASCQLAPGQVGTLAIPPGPPPSGAFAASGAPAALRAETPAGPSPAAQVGTRDRLAPLAPTRYALQATIGQDTHDLLRQAQALLGHAVPAGDLDPVLNRALRLLVHKLERRRFAGTDRPRPGHRRSAQSGRYVPAAVRREVWRRDRGRCTFVSDSGHRCEARTRLEFDHVTPFARGGRSSARDLRLRCRAHNQHAADQAFGAGFMDRKRREARLRSAAERGPGIAAVPPPGCVPVPSSRPASGGAVGSHDPEIIPWLRALGFRLDEARRAAEQGAGLRAAPLEERVRAAISFLAPASARPVARNGSTVAGMSGG